MTSGSKAWRTTGGPGERGVLILTAAPTEADAIARAVGGTAPARDWECVRLAPGIELVRSGVGKVNAALAVAKCVDPTRHGLVINMGVAGAYGKEARERLLKVVVASASVYADEGIQTASGFTDIAQAGFPPGGSTPDQRAFAGMGVSDEAVCAEVVERLGGASACLCGAIMTVSTCSGTDELATAFAARHSGMGAGAIAEGMEGAAAGHAVARLFGGRVRFGEVRVISNTTGDRAKQVWKIREAMEVLGQTARRLTAPTARA